MDVIEAIYAASGLDQTTFSLVFCVVIAWVVSLDACALTICQSGDLTLRIRSKKEDERNVFGAGLRHAFWHAFLFVAYLSIIELVSGLTYLITFALTQVLVWLAEPLAHLLPLLREFIPEDLDSFFSSFKRAFNTFVGVGTIVLVWITYRSKIIENHREKTVAGVSFGRRKDIEGLFRIVRCFPFVRRFADHALALTVAIDMLAVTAIIRVKFAWVSDAASGEGWHFGFWEHSPWTSDPTVLEYLRQLPTILSELGLFTLILLMVVFLMTSLSGLLVLALRKLSFGQSGSKTRLSERAVEFGIRLLRLGKNPTLLFLRVLEPFIIFSILGTTVAHLFVGPQHTGMTSWTLSQQVCIVLVFGCSMLASLVIAVGPRTIWEEVTAGSNITIKNHPELTGLEFREEWVLFRAFLSTVRWWSLAGWILVWSIGMVLIFASAYVEGDARLSLANFVHSASLLLGVISLVCLVTSEKFLQQETLVRGTFDRLAGLGSMFLSKLHFGVLLSAALVLMYLQITFSRGPEAVLQQIDPVVGGMLTIILIAELCFIFFALRERRSHGAGQPYVVTASEFWTAALGAIFVVQTSQIYLPDQAPTGASIWSMPLIIPSILMGLGIAVDVAIATIARFRDASMNFRNWAVPVALSHIMLPALGYYGWWFLGQQFESLGLLLGLLAFGLIAVFLYEAICEWLDAKPLVSLEPLTAWLFKGADDSSRGRFIMIMAVSMDALWSGPAKAAQAESGQWTPMEVFASFFIAGAVVAIVAGLSLLAAKGLRRSSFNDTNRMAKYLVGGKYVEATILFSFGLLSLWNAFAFWIGLGSLVECIAASGAFMLVIWIVFRKRFIREQLKELEEQPSS